MRLKTCNHLILILTMGFIFSVGKCDIQDLEKYKIFPGVDSFNASTVVKVLETNLERNLRHWYPSASTDYRITGSGIIKDECIDRSPIEDFPDDLFTQEQRLQGAIILHFIGAFFAFSFMAIVVDSYFIPSVWCICEDLKFPPDLAAATFMATATAMPECFTNVIAIFITESDMGIGTILSSLLFNTVGVGALLGLTAKKTLKFDWWPLTRDCFIFSINISALCVFMWDSRIEWYEAMVMVILLISYYSVMMLNSRMMKIARRLCEEKWRLCKKTSYDFGDPVTEAAQEAIAEHKQSEKVSTPVYVIPDPNQEPDAEGRVVLKDPDQVVYKMVIKYPMDDDLPNIWSLPRRNFFSTLWFGFTWPIRFLLYITVPDPRRMRKLYPVTFIVCIVWIAAISYKIFWMLTIIGYTFGIPDSVMGLTFLAAGSCTPEATAAIIMARKGEASMGLSNSLGTSSLNILMSLGLPWFIRTMIVDEKGNRFTINVQSHGMEFTALTLILAIILVYSIITSTKYRLTKKIGIVFLVIYLLLLTFAILVELDVFFPSGNIC